jgi:putative DNA primase/helicase
MTDVGQEWRPNQPPDDQEPAYEGAVQHRGQLRLAERFAAQHARSLRYAHGLGWLAWDGTRWAPDRDGAAMRAAVATVKAALHELADLDNEARKALYADVQRVQSASGLQGVLTIAGSLHPLAIAAHRLDPDPHLFNATNGTLDLRTGQLRPHDPADLITKVAGCGLYPDAVGVGFDKFLTEILPHAEVRDFVQRVAGAAMLGTVREHVLPIYTGTGFNGKGTLLDVQRAAFGDYAIEADPDLLVDRGHAHPTGQADLLGVRFAVASETDEGHRLAAARVKRLTGGDPVRARKMHKDFFQFDPSHHIVMMTNFKPKVSGDDPALWRRLLVVPFDVVITEQQQDVGLPERLAVELPAVLAWAYAGYRDYATRGLDPPPIVVERTNAYQLSSDTLGRFLDDRTITTTTAGHVRAGDLYAEWVDWCKANGEDKGSEVTFSEAMKRHGHDKKRTNIGRIYPGLILAAKQDETNSR